MNAKALVDTLLEWHENARLEVAAHSQDGPYLFFRNKLLAGQIMQARKDENNLIYIAGMGVQRSLQRTGFGKAMLQYVLEAFPNATGIDLHSAAHQFYHKLGGQRQQGYRFTIPRDKFTGSPFKFAPISWEQGQSYRGGRRPTHIDFEHKRHHRNDWQRQT